MSVTSNLVPSSKNTITSKQAYFFLRTDSSILMQQRASFYIYVCFAAYRENLGPLFIRCHDVCAINSTVLILNFCQTQTIVAPITEAFRRVIKKMLNELLKVRQMCAPCFFRERRQNWQTAKKSSGKCEYSTSLCLLTFSMTKWFFEKVSMPLPFFSSSFQIVLYVYIHIYNIKYYLNI